MHHALFGPSCERSIVEYYQEVKSRLIQNDGSSFGYHFSDEDFYIYVIAHEYKHYSGSGTGLRSLLDTYVYLKKKDDTLDWLYIRRELEKLRISDFEAKNRSLAMHLFGNEELTREDREMLEYILSSGTYGTVNNLVQNRLEKCGSGFGGKVKYVFHRLFLPMDVVREAFPAFVRIPVLLPFLPIYRLFSGLTKRRTILLTEFRTLKDTQITAARRP